MINSSMQPYKRSAEGKYTVQFWNLHEMPCTDLTLNANYRDLHAINRKLESHLSSQQQVWRIRTGPLMSGPSLYGMLARVA